MTSEENYQKIIDREKKARRRSEELLEEKTRDHYLANINLKQQHDLLKNQKSRTELLLEISHLLSQDLSTHEYLQHFTNAVCKMGWPVGHVYLTSENEQYLISSNIWFLADEKYEAFKIGTMQMNLEKGVGLPGRVLEYQKSVWIPDVTQDTNFPRAALAQQLNLKGAFGIPINVNKKIIGVAEFFYSEIMGEDTYLLSVVEAAANELTIVLEKIMTQNQLQQSLNSLKQAQDQIVESEKMAALGMLMAGIAHEINTPLGAINASIDNINISLKEVLNQIPKLIKAESIETIDQFIQLINSSLFENKFLITREERTLKKQINQQLKEKGIQNSESIADTLVDIGVTDSIEPWVPYFKEDEKSFMMKFAYNISSLLRNRANIAEAVKRAAKVIFALRSYSHYENRGEKMNVNLKEEMEIILTLYHNQLKHGVEVIKNYQNIPEIKVFRDELNQVWTNLIHNSLYAMENKGVLTIDMYTEGDFMIVKITDTGKGIPKEIMGKIFDPFFTTKPKGEGSGLGLDIVKKIIDKHHGKILVESIVGKTSFTVKIPMTQLD